MSSGNSLADLPFDPVTPQQAGASASPEETGDTHESIARDKAARWSRAASMLAIASDGGLIIPALGPQWESRYTRRFAGEEVGGAQRLERLLELMLPLQGADRRASWAEGFGNRRPGPGAGLMGIDGRRGAH